MKLLVYSLLVVLSFAALPQGSLFEEDFSSKLQSSNLGRAIIKLAELQSHGVSFAPLWDALKELGESIELRRTEENQLYDKDQSSYVSDQQFYSNKITEYKNEIATLQVDISDLQDARTHLEYDLSLSNQELSDTTVLKTQLEQTIAQNKVQFEKSMKEYTQAITVIDEAYELLLQVKDSSSFLQKGGDKQLKITSEKLRNSLKQMNRRRVFYQAFITSMTNIATSEYKFVDQELLSKTLKCLSDLKNSLVQNKQSYENDYNVDLKTNQQILSEYNEKIEDLTKVVIPTIQEEIETKIGEIKTKNGLLNDAQQNLSDAQESYNLNEDRWLKRTASHRDLVGQYDKDLSLLQEVDAVLKRGGIPRQ